MSNLGAAECTLGGVLPYFLHSDASGGQFWGSLVLLGAARGQFCPIFCSWEQFLSFFGVFLSSLMQFWSSLLPLGAV